MSDTPRRYQIRTVADFDAVPDDKIDACISDFLTYCEFRRLSRALLDPEVAAVTDFFEWIDDGEEGVSEIRFVVDQPPTEEQSE